MLAYVGLIQNLQKLNINKPGQDLQKGEPPIPYVAWVSCSNPNDSNPNDSNTGGDLSRPTGSKPLGTLGFPAEANIWKVKAEPSLAVKRNPHPTRFGSLCVSGGSGQQVISWPTMS